jgi:hypothetical protein
MARGIGHGLGLVLCLVEPGDPYYLTRGRTIYLLEVSTICWL